MRELEVEATRGPWGVFAFGVVEEYEVQTVRDNENDVQRVAVCQPGQAWPDMPPLTGAQVAHNFTFMARARTFVPRTLDALDAADARIAELEGQVADARELVLMSEWGSSGDTFCPGCGGWADRGGHKASCALAAFLSKTAPCPTVDEMIGG